VSDELANFISRAAQLWVAGIDTPPEVEGRYHAMLVQRTGEERLIMGCAMRDTALKPVEASLREQNPLAGEAEIRKGVFLRFYGHEFDAPTRAKILAAIEQAVTSGIR
jgi:hypothetical protein